MKTGLCRRFRCKLRVSALPAWQHKGWDLDGDGDWDQDEAEP